MIYCSNDQTDPDVARYDSMPPNWNHPPLAKGATSREQDVVTRAYHLAEKLPDRRMIGPIRDAVELLVELIEGRGKRRDFDEQWGRPHDD